MTDSDPLRRYVEAGLALTQLTRAKAEALVRDWVKAGDLQREQAQDRVEELLDRSKRSTDSLVAMIRREMSQQLSSMGFATKADLAAMEARLMGRPTGARSGPAAKAKAGTTPTKAASKPSKAATVEKAATAATRPTKTATPPAGTAARKAAATRASGRGPKPGAPDKS